VPHSKCTIKKASPAASEAAKQAMHVPYNYSVCFLGCLIVCVPSKKRSPAASEATKQDSKARQQNKNEEQGSKQVRKTTSFGLYYCHVFDHTRRKHFPSPLILFRVECKPQISISFALVPC